MDAPEIRLRESPRLEVEGRARLFLGAADPGIEARLLDLSATGMGLASPAAPAPGQVFAFELAIDGAKIEGRGVLVWSRRARPDRGDAPNLGVRFAELDPASAVAIATLLDRLSAGVRRPPAPRSPAATLSLPSADIAPAPALTVATVEITSAVAPIAPAPPAIAQRAAAQEADPPVLERAAPERRKERSRDAAGELEEVGSAPPPRSQRFRFAWIAGAAAAATVLAVLGYRSFDDGAPSPPPGAAAPPAAERGVPLEPAPESAAERASEPLPEPASEPAPEPVPEAIAAAAPAAADATATTARARRLLAIEPGRAEDGEVLTLRADGPLRRQDVFAALIGIDPPRYLIRISGIERPWRPPNLEVGTPLIQRVRTGLHSTPRGPELHIVLDLPSRAVEHDWEIDGDLLRVRLRPRAP